MYRREVKTIINKRLIINMLENLRLAIILTWSLLLSGSQESSLQSKQTNTSGTESQLNCYTNSSTCNMLAENYKDTLAFEDVCHLDVESETNQYGACRDLCIGYYDKNVTSRYRMICDSHCPYYNLTLCLGRKTTTAKPNLQPDTPYTLRQCCTADTHDLCQSSDAMRRDCGGTCYVDEVRQQENQNRSCAVLCNSTLLRRVIECEDKCPDFNRTCEEFYMQTTAISLDPDKTVSEAPGCEVVCKKIPIWASLLIALGIIVVIVAVVAVAILIWRRRQQQTNNVPIQGDAAQEMERLNREVRDDA